MRVLVMLLRATLRCVHVEEVSMDAVNVIFSKSHLDFYQATLFIHENVQEHVTDVPHVGIPSSQEFLN